ncbi:hydroxyphenylacetyl-CoA thioesterase PaaI [Piscinibacter sp.]|uniref:hydroxyphenylacetyl-CoA thioesterase PaaI n=1 Tax=Piscinibacter sp. TaxID=1903157 RepID=UPI0039E2458A
MTEHNDAQALAERVRDAMFATDKAAHALGMEVSAIAPGSASVTMTVRETMLNGFGTCQGGLIATLADMAFAYACNSYNEMTVASGFEVDLLGPARAGEQLTASANVVSQGARLGLYDITVTNAGGERIAVFRGRSYRMKGKQVVPA